jgi:hypothetical protein
VDYITYQYSGAVDDHNNGYISDAEERSAHPYAPQGKLNQVIALQLLHESHCPHPLLCALKLVQLLGGDVVL